MSIDVEVGNTYRYIGRQDEYFTVIVTHVDNGDVTGRIIDCSDYFYSQRRDYAMNKLHRFSILTEPHDWLLIEQVNKNPYKYLFELLNVSQ